jgi:hypothetical protein
MSFILSFLSPSIVDAQVDTLSWDLIINQEWERPAKLDSFLSLHPRYLLTQAKVNDLKDKISSAGIHQDIWNLVKAKANSYLGENPPGGENEEDMRNSGRAIPWLALAYLIADEPDDSTYLNKAISWMLTVCGYSNWYRNYSIGAAEGLVGVSIGYDWLYNELSTSEKNTIRNKLILQANIMKDWPPQQHDRYLANHCHVEYNGLAAAGFVLYDEVPEAINWIKQADLIFKTAFKLGSDDGSSTEGHQYWGYSMESLLCFTEAAKDLMSINYYDSNWLKGAIDFIIFSTIPDFNLLPDEPDFANCVISFGDSHRDYRSHGPTHILCRLASEYNNGYAQWLADEMIQRGIGLTNYDFRAWANLIWYDESITPTSLSNLPTFKHFDDIGWITSRSGWDEDAVLVGFKCGPFHGHKLMPYYEKQADESWDQYHFIVNGHGHPDVNSFQIYAHGKWLATEPGYARPKWTSDHCTILMNENGQLGDGEGSFNRAEVMETKASSAIIKTESNQHYDYVVGDAENIYRDSGLNKFYRHFVYIKPDLIVIADELEAIQSSNYFEWRLRTRHNRDEFVDNMIIEKQTDDFYIIKNYNDVDVVVMDVHFIHPQLENFSTGTVGNEFLIANFNSTGADLILSVLHPRRDEDDATSIVSSSFVDSVFHLTIGCGAEKVNVQLDLARQELAVITDVQNRDWPVKPSRYALMQSYPNPFNPSTKIKFALPKPGEVKIEVYNIIGHKIEELFSQYMKAGHDEVEFNAQNLSSDVYFYRIEVRDPARKTVAFQDVKKMVLLK